LNNFLEQAFLIVKDEEEIQVSSINGELKGSQRNKRKSVPFEARRENLEKKYNSKQISQSEV